MLVIRLSRVGKKKQPIYRVVVQEKQRDPWGTSVEIVGNYNPLTEPKTIVLKEERIKYWISQGAQPSDTVHNLLVDAKVISDSKRRATTHDKKEVTEEEKAAEAKEEKKEEAPAEEKKEEAPAEEPKEEKAEEVKEEPKESPSAEATGDKEAPAEEKKEEAPAEEAKDEEKAE